MPQITRSASLPDYFFEKKRNIQYREGYFTVISGIVCTEDITVCSVY